MEVILLERVSNLGAMGEVVKVKPGYARNFLLPRKKALRASKENLAFFEAKKAEIEAANNAKIADAQTLADKLEGLQLVMVRQAAETGLLYGSVTARDITDAVRDQDIAIERGAVELNQPIKELGSYQVDIALHPEVTVTIDVAVGRSEDDAKAQFEKAAELLEHPEEFDAEEAEEAVEAAHEIAEEAVAEEAEATEETAAGDEGDDEAKAE